MCFLSKDLGVILKELVARHHKKKDKNFCKKKAK